MDIEINVPAKLYQRIQMLADDLGISKAEVIDRAVMILNEARKVTRSHEADRNQNKPD